MIEVPADWELKRVSQVSDVVRGVTYSKSDVLSVPSDGAIPLLRATNIQPGKLDYDDPVWLPEGIAKPAQVLKPGDLVVATSSGSLTVIGKNARVIHDHRATFGAFCTVIRPTNIDGRFLAYWLESPTVRQLWSEKARGSNINNLKSSDLAETVVPVPPLVVQQLIVETLEEHLSRLDKALAEVREGIVRTRSLRRSILRAAFSGNLLAGLDMGVLKPLGGMGFWRGGGTPSKTNQSFWRNGEIPWLTAKDMISFKTSTTQDLITEAAVSASSATLIPSGAVVVVARSGILERKLPVTVTEVDVTVNQDMKALTCLSGINPEWVAYGLLAFEQEILRTCRKAGTTVANLNFQDFLRFEIPVPSLEIQHQILEALELHLGEIDSTGEVLHSTENEISVMRRSLLHAAFTGQLTNEEPND